jgi:hypothetical protein
VEEEIEMKTRRKVITPENDVKRRRKRKSGMLLAK